MALVSTAECRQVCKGWHARACQIICHRQLDEALEGWNACKLDQGCWLEEIDSQAFENLRHPTKSRTWIKQITKIKKSEENDERNCSESSRPILLRRWPGAAQSRTRPVLIDQPGKKALSKIKSVRSKWWIFTRLESIACLDSVSRGLLPVEAIQRYESLVIRGVQEKV